MLCTSAVRRAVRASGTIPTRSALLSEPFEALESRRLMAATQEVALPGGGLELRVITDTADDIITVAADPAGGLLVADGPGGWAHTFTGDYSQLFISPGWGNDTVTIDASVTLPVIVSGGEGDDHIVGGSGNDRLYGGGGTNVLDGGAGDDILVTLGGTLLDQPVGGTGRDSFWVDGKRGTRELPADLSPEEIATGSLHKVTNFWSPPNQPRGQVISLDGSDLPDPLLSDGRFGYENLSRHRLFSDAGPSPEDVMQGEIGDCYAMAVLSSLAKLNPTRVRESVVELGDGTYAVQFRKGNARVYLRVDGDLPVEPQYGMPAYASFGAQESTWVAVIEKAYASYRNGGRNGYAGLDLGWMRETYKLFGLPSRTFRAATSSILLGVIHRELVAGRSVTLGTLPTVTGPLVDSHAYVVESVEFDTAGNAVAVRLRNPWGFDGEGDDGSDDGYVRVTAQQVFTSYSAAVTALA